MFEIWAWKYRFHRSYPHHEISVDSSFTNFQHACQDIILEAIYKHSDCRRKFICFSSGLNPPVDTYLWVYHKMWIRRQAFKLYIKFLNMQWRWYWNFDNICFWFYLEKKVWVDICSVLNCLFCILLFYGWLKW